ncbi:MAG: Gfo/Idh/MocA family oxidoreductase [Planctomycetota bacterium]|nr:Gfo/Idh/MocA family oxidoreductase [Planctomycetota bacterium]MDA1137522.1 Gfo/Idh/MocA family oxidoreductase [Planctomycetota bacterium]
MPYQVAIIGTGSVSRAHANACRAHPDTEITVAVDTSQENLQKFCTEFGITRQYTDVEQMLNFESEIDLAIICSWGSTHAETSNFIARSRGAKAILVEKPIAMNAGEAADMVEAAATNEVLITEGFKFRHHPQHIKVKQMVDSGLIGELKNIRSNFCTLASPGWRKPGLSWKYNREKGGSCINDLASDCIHHARYIYGTEPEKVFCSAQMGEEVEEAADITLAFPGGKCAQISVGFNYQASQYVEISGTKGMFRIDPAWENEGREATVYMQDSRLQRINYPIPATFQFLEQLRNICQYLKSGDSPRIPAEDSISQMMVMDAVFQSISTGASVNL